LQVRGRAVEDDRPYEYVAAHEGDFANTREYILNAALKLHLHYVNPDIA
jgi:hypothetical protein